MPVLNKKPKEDKLEKWARKEAKDYDIIFWKLRTPGNIGAPDRIIIGYGVIEFIEFKRSENHKLSAIQFEVTKWLRKRGFKVHVIYTKEEVTRVFTAVARLSSRIRKGTD